MLAGIPVYKSAHAAAGYDDGRPRLFTFVRDRRLGGPFVLVHPSRWDAFYMAVNQPDAFSHPEVQELLGWTLNLDAGLDADRIAPDSDENASRK